MWSYWEQVVQKIVRIKEKEGTGLRRRLEDGKLHYLYSASNIVGMRNWRKLHAAWDVGTMRELSRILSENLQRWSHLKFVFLKEEFCRSQWPRGLRRRSRLLRLWVRIPLGGMDVCLLWVLCVVSGGLCVGLITRPEESCRLWCVVVCDLRGLEL